MNPAPSSLSSDETPHPSSQMLEILQRLPVDINSFSAKLASLRILLSEANEKTNLTRITGTEEFWVKHVYDSMLLAEAYPAIFANDARFGDIGCGAGFPSLVLATAFPRIRMTAIDSRNKKTAFVEMAAERLGLTNVSVVTGRGRELARKDEFKNRFDIVVARAVADAPTVLREIRGMLSPGSSIILYKSPETAESELHSVRSLKTAMEFEWETTGPYELPEGMGSRAFLRGLRLRSM